MMISNVVQQNYISDDDEMSPDKSQGSIINPHVANIQSVVSSLSPPIKGIATSNDYIPESSVDSINPSEFFTVDAPNIFPEPPNAEQDTTLENILDNVQTQLKAENQQEKTELLKKNSDDNNSVINKSLFIKNQSPTNTIDSQASSLAPYTTSLSLPIHVSPNIKLEDVRSSLVSPESILDCFSNVNENKQNKQNEQKQISGNNLQLVPTHQNGNNTRGSSIGVLSSEISQSVPSYIYQSNTNDSNQNQNQNPNQNQMKTDIETTVSNLQNLIMKMHSRPMSIIKDSKTQQKSNSSSTKKSGVNSQCDSLSESLTIAIIDNNTNNNNNNNDKGNGSSSESTQNSVKIIQNNSSNVQQISDATIREQLATIRDTISQMINVNSSNTHKREKSSDASSLQSSDFIIINNKLSMAISQQQKQSLEKDPSTPKMSQIATLSNLGLSQSPQPLPQTKQIIDEIIKSGERKRQRQLYRQNTIEHSNDSSMMISDDVTSAAAIAANNMKWLAWDQEFEIERMDRISRAMDFLVEMSLKCQGLVLKKKQIILKQQKTPTYMLRSGKGKKISPIFNGSSLLKLWQSRPPSPTKHFFKVGDTTMKCDWILFVKCKNLVSHKNQLLWDITVRRRIYRFNNRQMQLRENQYENSFTDRHHQKLWKFGSPRQLSIAEKSTKNRHKIRNDRKLSLKTQLQSQKVAWLSRNTSTARPRTAPGHVRGHHSRSSVKSSQPHAQHFTFVTPSMRKLSSQLPPTNVFDRLSRPKKKKVILTSAEQEAKRCTFKPRICNKSKRIFSKLGYPPTSQQRQHYFERLYHDAEARATKQKIAQEMAKAAKMEYIKDTCPFRVPEHSRSNSSFICQDINTAPLSPTMPYQQQLYATTQYISEFDMESPSHSNSHAPSQFLMDQLFDV